MRAADYIEPDFDAQTARWLESLRASTAPRPHLVLDPSRAAVLVVDMLRYFAAPEGRCHLPASDRVGRRIRRLVEAWRSRGRPVVFTRHCHRGPEDLGMLGRFFGDHIEEADPDSQIIDSLSPGALEPVFEKTTYDAFLGTGLEDALRDLEVEQVVISGVLTHMCCETTARAAFCRGFEVYLPVDALASTTEQRHLCSLSNLADAVAIPLSTAEVIELCRGTR